MSAMLSQLNNLIEFYDQFEQDSKGISRQVLASVAQEKESLMMLAKSSALIFQALSREIEVAGKNLNNYEKELDKAEKDYQKSLEAEHKKKEEAQEKHGKPKKPKLDKAKLEAATAAIMAKPPQNETFRPSFEG
jgi:multidrug resistance efflux pump